MIKTFTLAEMRELHKERGGSLMFSYFTENYCHKLLEDTEGLKKIEVIVSADFKYEFVKKTLEVVR